MKLMTIGITGSKVQAGTQRTTPGELKEMLQKSRNALLANTSWAIIDAAVNHAQIEKDTAHLIGSDAMCGSLLAHCLLLLLG
jgi:hypothetical protein